VNVTMDGSGPSLPFGPPSSALRRMDESGGCGCGLKMVKWCWACGDAASRPDEEDSWWT